MKKVGILYDNISGNTGDVAVGISVRNLLNEIGVEFEELVIGRFNPLDYHTIVIGGGSLLRPGPDYIHDKFRIQGKHVLNCCGINGFPDDLYYLNQYLYLTVRSQGDKNKLNYLSKNVDVVPCTTMLLKDLKEFDLKIDNPSIGIHLSGGIVDEKSVIDYLAKLPYKLYFLPITHYNYDYKFLLKLSSYIKNSVMLPILSPSEIFTLIGKFNYFISSSLHGAIFAYVHNVPFVLYGGPDARINFLLDRGLEKYIFESVDQLKATVDSILNSKISYLEKLNKDLLTLEDHRKKLKEILPGNTFNVIEVDQISHPKNGYDEINFKLYFLQKQNENLMNAVLMHNKELHTQILNQYNTFINKVLPLGTKGRGGYELVMSGIRVFITEGAESFFHKLRYFIRRK